MDGRNFGRGIENEAALLRSIKSLWPLYRVFRNPDDTEQVLAAALLLNAGTLPRVLARFESMPEGRELLATRLAVDAEHIELDALAALPEGSFGRAYSSFMRERGLTPELFVPRPQIRDERLRYVSQRLSQTHDIWHVVTGYDTDMVGELELQAFTFGQMRAPFALVVATLGVLRIWREPAVVARKAWRAYRRGCRARPLCAQIWEREFIQPLADVRQRLALI